MARGYFVFLSIMTLANLGLRLSQPPIFTTTKEILRIFTTTETGMAIFPSVLSVSYCLKDKPIKKEVYDKIIKNAPPSLNASGNFGSYSVIIRTVPWRRHMYEYNKYGDRIVFWFATNANVLIMALHEYNDKFYEQDTEGIIHKGQTYNGSLNFLLSHFFDDGTAETLFKNFGLTEWKGNVYFVCKSLTMVMIEFRQKLVFQADYDIKIRKMPDYFTTVRYTSFVGSEISKKQNPLLRIVLSDKGHVFFLYDCFFNVNNLDYIHTLNINEFVDMKRAIDHTANLINNLDAINFADTPLLLSKVFNMENVLNTYQQSIGFEWIAKAHEMLSLLNMIFYCSDDMRQEIKDAIDPVLLSAPSSVLQVIDRKLVVHFWSQSRPFKAVKVTFGYFLVSKQSLETQFTIRYEKFRVPHQTPAGCLFREFMKLPDGEGLFALGTNQ